MAEVLDSLAQTDEWESRTSGETGGGKMTRNSEAGTKLDSLVLKLRCGVELVSAVSDCISDGPNAPGTYSDALFGAVQYLRGIHEQMTDLVNELLRGDGNEQEDVCGPRPL